MRRRGKVDCNHAEVRDAFRKCGCEWLDLSSIGSGAPDGLATAGGERLALIEIKDGKGGKLTDDQEAFHAKWTVFVIRDVAQVIEVVQWLKKQ